MFLGKFANIEKRASARHVIVTGHSGAGKSTLAESFGLPIHALDDDPAIHREIKRQMAYAKSRGGRLPTDRSYSKAMERAEQDAIQRALALDTPHVIDGAYVLNRDPSDFKDHDLHLVDTPVSIVLDRRTERQRKRDLSKGRGWDHARARGVRLRGQQLVDEYEPGVRRWRESGRVTKHGTEKRAAAPRDYKREYRLFHSSPEAKRNRAKRNLWNRRLKGKVPAGYEIDHKRQLRDGGGNGRDNIRFMRVSQNRAEHNRSRAVKDHMRKESAFKQKRYEVDRDKVRREALKYNKRMGTTMGVLLGGLAGSKLGPIGIAGGALGGGLIGKKIGSKVGISGREVERQALIFEREMNQDPLSALEMAARGTGFGGAPVADREVLRRKFAKTASFDPYLWVYDSLVKEAGKKRRPRIALVRGSLGGDESLSNASANAYAEALRNEGFDIDEVDLSDVPFADQWDSDYKDKHRALLRESDATVFATPVYNWGPSARVNAYLQNAVKAGQDPYRPYAVLGAAGSQRSQGYLTSLQNSLAMEDKGINVGAPLVATEEDMIYKGEKLKGVSDKYKERLAEHASILAQLARNRRKRRLKKTAAAIATKRDPAKWEAAKREAKAKMGGKHSARAMQLATQIYKKKGGTYAGKKPSPSGNKLRKWTKQDWKWSGGDTPGEGGKGVYLPKRSAEQLSSTKSGRAKLRRASRVKREATSRDQQFSSHGLHVGKKRSEVS